MKSNELRNILCDLFKINTKSAKYREFEFEERFVKRISKIKGKELYNALEKITKILSSDDLSHYKNLRYDLKKYKRVHVNKSYVIIFYDDKTKTVYFLD